MATSCSGSERHSPGCIVSSGPAPLTRSNSGGALHRAALEPARARRLQAADCDEWYQLRDRRPMRARCPAAGEHVAIVIVTEAPSVGGSGDRVFLVGIVAIRANVAGAIACSAQELSFEPIAMAYLRNQDTNGPISLRHHQSAYLRKFHANHYRTAHYCRNCLSAVVSKRVRIVAS